MSSEAEEILERSGFKFLGVGEIGTASFESVLKRLAAEVKPDMDPLARQLVREGAVRALSEAGCKSPAQLVDAAINPKPGRKVDDDPAMDLYGEPVSPADWLVDGSELLEEAVYHVGRFCVTGSAIKIAVALWVLASWVFRAFDFFGMLLITSATLRCGKSTLLSVVSCLVNRPLVAANATTAALFRLVDRDGPTALLDECDTFLHGNEELRGLLNAGVERGGAVLRCDGDDNEPKRFAAYCPKILSMIRKPAGTLLDRCVVLNLKRKKRGEETERLRMSKLRPELLEWRRRAAKWATDHAEALEAINPKIPKELNDRQADCWRPLLAVADVIGGDWPDKARKAAKDLSGEELDGAELGVLLLADLKEIFEETKRDKIASAELCERLAENPEKPWKEYGRARKPITQRQLAGLLKPFGIAPSVRRDGKEVFRGYLRETFDDSFERYGSSFRLGGVSEALHCYKSSGERVSADFQALQDETLLHMENGLKPNGGLTCNDVTLETPPMGGEGDETHPPSYWGKRLFGIGEDEK